MKKIIMVLLTLTALSCTDEYMVENHRAETLFQLESGITFENKDAVGKLELYLDEGWRNDTIYVEKITPALEGYLHGWRSISSLGNNEFLIQRHLLEHDRYIPYSGTYKPLHLDEYKIQWTEINKTGRLVHEVWTNGYKLKVKQDRYVLFKMNEHRILVLERFDEVVIKEER